MPVRILDTARAQAILQRMAYEIAERNYGAEALLLAPLSVRGEYLGHRLVQLLQAIGPMQLHYAPWHAEHHLAQRVQGAAAQNMPIVLVDDVLYTGRTLFTGLHHLHALQPSLVQVAVLIDRGHRSYPVAADYIGMQLATTLQEYVRVQVDEAQHSIAAFLE